MKVHNIYVVYQEGGGLTKGDTIFPETFDGSKDGYFNRKEYVYDVDEDEDDEEDESAQTIEPVQFITTQNLLALLASHGYTRVVIIDYSCDVCDLPHAEMK